MPARAAAAASPARSPNARRPKAHVAATVSVPRAACSARAPVSPASANARRFSVGTSGGA